VRLSFFPSPLFICRRERMTGEWNTFAVIFSNKKKQALEKKKKKIEYIRVTVAFSERKYIFTCLS